MILGIYHPDSWKTVDCDAFIRIFQSVPGAPLPSWNILYQNKGSLIAQVAVKFMSARLDCLVKMISLEKYIKTLANICYDIATRAGHKTR